MIVAERRRCRGAAAILAPYEGAKPPKCGESGGIRGSTGMKKAGKDDKLMPSSSLVLLSIQPPNPHKGEFIKYNNITV